ncbi:MAG TPA: hypothetical protein PK022_06870 [Syntrophales bacterium]|jgi:hypothetical protein|nr:hypothetical protein [Syntrophales bacterium]
MGKRGPKPGTMSRKGVIDLSRLETLYSIGLIDAQVCKVLEITEQTLSLYKKDDKLFAAIKRGKQVADDRVERALYERATGYSHPDTDIRVVDGKIVTTEIIKHYPPDTTACIFWLKNRRRAEWRDKQEVEHSGNLTVNVIDRFPTGKK